MRAFTLVLIVGAAASAVVGVAPKNAVLLSILQPRYSEVVGRCHAVDGDTIRCGDERIRLMAISAPELPNHCAPGSACKPVDLHAATLSLSQGMSTDLRIERVAADDYGHTLAIVAGEHGDLSCWQLSHRQAIYTYKSDSDLRVARMCPREAWGR